MNIQDALPLLRSAMMAVVVSTAAAPALDHDTTVTIKSFMFTPMSVTVHAGDTVVWKNLDEEPHTVTSVTGDFRSGGIDGGGSYRFTFAKPGTYKYTCSIHPQMTGTITVR